MATLLRMLEPPTSSNGTREKEKPVVLIVDEFDLFALHPRQSFLYCLLDIVQGNRRKSGMGVIGLSSRTVSSPCIPFNVGEALIWFWRLQDCLSILEKRVRSRCQSQVHQMVLPNSFSDYVKRTQSLLMAHADSACAEDAEGDELTGAWNDEVKVRQPLQGWQSTARSWLTDSIVQAFVANDDVKRYLERLWRTHGSTPTHLLKALVRLLPPLART